MSTSKLGYWIGFCAVGIVALAGVVMLFRVGPRAVVSSATQSEVREPQAQLPYSPKPIADTKKTYLVPPSNATVEFERARNLLPLFERAGGLNVESLTIKAKVLNECRILATSPEWFAPLNNDEGAGLYGENASRAREFASRFQERCGDFARVRKPTIDEARQALRDAASGGSPWARARLFQVESKTLAPGDADAELSSILSTRDGDALGALSDVMSVPLYAGSEFEDLAGTPLHAYAWTLASCDLGRDCSAQSELMRQSCLFGLMCGPAEDFHELLSNYLVTPADFLKVQQIEASILRASNN
jgi:hypothetical protein